MPLGGALRTCDLRSPVKSSEHGELVVQDEAAERLEEQVEPGQAGVAGWGQCSTSRRSLAVGWADTFLRFCLRFLARGDCYLFIFNILKHYFFGGGGRLLSRVSRRLPIPVGLT